MFATLNLKSSVFNICLYWFISAWQCNNEKSHTLWYRKISSFLLSSNHLTSGIYSFISTPQWVVLNSYCASGDGINTDNGIKLSLNLAFRFGQLNHCGLQYWQPPARGELGQPSQLEITTLETLKIKQHEFHSPCPKKSELPFFSDGFHYVIIKISFTAPL